MNNLKDIINIEKHNFNNIFCCYSSEKHKCANFYCRSHNKNISALKMFCKGCNKFVCSTCINKNASQCLICCKNNNDTNFKCEFCDRFYEIICWTCGKGINCGTGACPRSANWRLNKLEYYILFCSKKCINIYKDEILV